MHRRQFIATLGTIGFVGCQARPSEQTAVVIEPTESTWNQYRGSPKKQGYTPKDYPTGTPINLHPTNRPKYTAPPVLNRQDILIPTPENIVALDPNDRTEKYRFPLESSPSLPPAASSNVLLLAGEELHGYDLRDHSLKWERSSSRTYSLGAAPVAFSKHFVVQDGNRLRCIEEEAGSLIWEHSFDARLVGFAATPETVIALRQAKRTAELIALDTVSGSQKWALETAPSQATPIPGDHIYSVSESGRLTAIQKGEVSWEVDTGLVNPEVISTSDEYVILGPDDSDRFVGINKADQAESWRTQLEFASPPLITSDSVFVPTANDGIITLDLDSGKQQHTYSETRFIEYLVPYDAGLLLTRQTDERIEFMDFSRS